MNQIRNNAINNEIQENLLKWFDKNKRDLPWRKTKDPYKIWISEIMLQQTRVDTVIQYYQRFVKRFPAVKELAEADEQDVLKHWQGLGYYSRVRNLHKGAKMILKQYHGIFPDTMEEIKKIPGIGPYTAGAVLSIAFNQPYPAVDGNVLRVFSRIMDIHEDIAQASTVKLIQEKVKELIPQGRASDFTEALMELGALLCIPANPLCLACPLYEQCEARARGVQNDLPVKTKKQKPKKMHMVFCVVKKGEEILMIKNPANGLLGGLWSFPGKEAGEKQDEEAVNQILEELKLNAIDIKKIGTARHIFTHMDWDMHIYQCAVKNKEKIDEEHLWITKEEFGDYPIPKVYQKVCKLILNSNNMDN
ncbi:A/G-specific adenine glycosylase [Petroclostridium sp. X23]|uniref:A/G-specific adenine glycosylase n=1 Tax=Petroclostridium sp. X23 TaxID=3045146 RepID=UPI0024AD5786|nr:A/G-specific adenine glycosylase [Petroclostridium sp. X23]WHH61499.1 A/G-specific adenine glycosylase [Petroclostridium sp. X23]